MKFVFASIFDCTIIVVGAGTACTTKSSSGTVFPGASTCFGGKCMNYAQTCDEIGSRYESPPYYPCQSQTANNNGNFCGRLYCTNDLSKTYQCSYFEYMSGSSLYQQMEDGVPCSDGQQCLKGLCVSSNQLNQQYQWYVTDWAYCSNCDDPQYRNVSCQSISQIGLIVDDSYCTPSARPPSQQVCHNEELLCNYGNNDELQIWNNITVKKQSIMIGGISIIVVYLLSTIVCFKLLVRPDSELKYRNYDTRTIEQKQLSKQAPPGFTNAYRRARLQKKYNIHENRSF